MKARKFGNLALLLLFGTIVIWLAGCSSKADSQSVTGLLQKTTVYYTGNEKEALQELGTKHLHIDNSDTEQLAFIDYNTNISIKDTGDLVIRVDNVAKKLTVGSKVAGKAQEIYDVITNLLTTEKSKYLMLYSHLETDSDGNITNITYNAEDAQIEFDFSSFEEVDTRFIDLYYNEYNKYTGEYENGALEICDNSGTEKYLVFKNDAIYSIANTDNGIEALKRLNENTGKIIQLGDNIYKASSIATMVEDVNTTLTYNKTEKLAVDSLEKLDEQVRLKVFIKGDAIKFAEDIYEYLSIHGFDIEYATSQRDCDIAIGYTWLYNNSLQSTLDDTLAVALINHHNKSNKQDMHVEFILNTSWGLRVME